MSSEFGQLPGQVPPPVTPQADDRASSATAGFWLGLVGLVAWIIPFIGLPVTITGFVLSLRGRTSARGTFALAGLILSGFGVVFSVVMTADFIQSYATGQL
jgi:hypothetical protein